MDQLAEAQRMRQAVRDRRQNPVPVGRPAAARHAVARPARGGVGTEISKLLESFGIGTFKDCSCGRLKREWDAKGVEWCEAHRDEIVAALQANGKAKGWVFGVAAKLAAGPLVDLAIANVRCNDR